MAGDAAYFSNLHRYPTGRRVHALTEVERRAREKGIAHVAVHARRGVLHDQATLALEHERRGERRAIYGADAPTFDNLLDHALLGFEHYLQTQVRVFTADSVRGKAAGKLQASLFPRGAAALTRLAFMEEHEEVNVLLARVDTKELAEAVAVLPDARPLLDRIRELNQLYGKSLKDYGRPVPSLEELQAARDRGQELMVETVVLILAHYIMNAPDDDEDRAYLLEPIIRQNELIRQARRRRRAPGELDEEPGTDGTDAEAQVLDRLVSDPALPIPLIERPMA